MLINLEHPVYQEQQTNAVDPTRGVKHGHMTTISAAEFLLRRPHQCFRGALLAVIPGQNCPGQAPQRLTPATFAVAPAAAVAPKPAAAAAAAAAPGWNLSVG